MGKSLDCGMPGRRGNSHRPYNPHKPIAAQNRSLRAASDACAGGTTVRRQIVDPDGIWATMRVTLDDRPGRHWEVSKTMSLPPSLLQQVEQHGCFSGCYQSDADVRTCLDPAKSPEHVIVVSCLDCLSFKLGVLQALLPPTSMSFWLADQLTRHVRKLRGYTLSFAGYHARGPGFWLSGVYYGHCGMFLLDGARSRSLGSDLDLLLLAFKQGVIQPPDARMNDPHLYTTQVVYLDLSNPLVPVASRQDLLASPLCQAQPKKGFHRVTLAEYQPVAGAVAQAAGKPAAPSALVAGSLSAKAANLTSAAARGLKAGDVCPVCKAVVCERPLLKGTYIGCLC